MLEEGAHLPAFEAGLRGFGFRRRGHPERVLGGRFDGGPPGFVLDRSLHHGGGGLDGKGRGGESRLVVEVRPAGTVPVTTFRLGTLDLPSDRLGGRGTLRTVATWPWLATVAFAPSISAPVS